MTPARASAWMLLSTLAITGLAGCQNGGIGQKPKPFVSTPVPADFAIVVDENLNTYYARQHVQQVITASDMMSRTTYTTFRDYNNTVSSKFTQDQPLTAGQLQAMWDEVARNQLLKGGRVWLNWLSDADLYRQNDHVIQVRANGQVKTYHRSNGYGPGLRPLMLQVEGVRLPLTQGGHPVVPATTEPATRPSASAPASSEPIAPPATETEPTSQPVRPSTTSGPALD